MISRESFNQYSMRLSPLFFPKANLRSRRCSANGCADDFFFFERERERGGWVIVGVLGTEKKDELRMDVRRGEKGSTFLVWLS